MAKIVYLDFKDEEVYEYVFNCKKGVYENSEIKNLPFSFEKDTFDLQIDKCDYVYVSLPVSVLNFRVIELPFSEKEKIDKVLAYELEGKILCKISDIVFDSLVVGKVDNKHKVLVVYLEKQKLKSILTRLNTQGIDPICITSIEVRNLIGGFSIDKILTPVALKVEERVSLAKEDLRSPVINLRKDEFVCKSEVEKQKKSIKTTILLLTLFLSLNLVNFFVNFVSLKKESASIKNDIRKMYQSLFPQEKNIYNEIYQMRSHIKELEDKEEIFLGISPLKVLLDISGLDRNGLYLNELLIDRINIVAKGEADSLSKVQEFRDKLSKIYSDVKVVETKELVQGKVGFTISIKGKTL